jgi:hypothetical protein
MENIGEKFERKEYILPEKLILIYYMYFHARPWKAILTLSIYFGN